MMSLTSGMKRITEATQGVAKTSILDSGDLRCSALMRGSIITASPIQLGAMMSILFIYSVTARGCAWF